MFKIIYNEDPLTSEVDYLKDQTMRQTHFNWKKHETKGNKLKYISPTLGRNSILKEKF
jgi:hypothetical protein